MNQLNPSREIQRVPVSLLRRDPNNTRRKYSREALEELADSIYHDGVMENGECGPDGTMHMGNRRLYATVDLVIPRLCKEIEEATGEENRLAMLRERLEDRMLFPVRVLTGEQAKDALIRQLVENLQREGVSPRDEAEGYARLLEERDEAGNAKWTADSIAERIGKGRTGQYVHNRMKLLRTPQEVLDALEAGAVTIRTAEMIGRVPSAEARKELAGRVLRPRYSDKPLSEKETAELIREEFMISLSKASFDQEDGGLCPEAGTCSACPMRSGNDPALEGSLRVATLKGGARGMGGATSGIAGNVCTNPTCFRAKSAAAWARLGERARAEGFDLLDEVECGKVFNERDGSLRESSGWVDLDGKPGFEFTGAALEVKGAPKWRVILKDAGIRVTKGRNPKTGGIVDLARKSVVKEAVRLMLDAARVKPAEERPKQVELFARFEAKARKDEDGKRAAEESRREGKIRQGMAIAGADALLDAMTRGEDEGKDLEPGVMVAVLGAILGDSADACAFFALWLGLERPHAGAAGRDFLPAILEHVTERERPYTVRELFALIAFASVAGAMKWQGIEAGPAKDLAKVLGVNLGAVGKRAREEFLREERAKRASRDGKTVTGKTVNGGKREGETERGGEGEKPATGKTVNGGKREATAPEVSLLGPDHPKAAENERLLIGLEIAIQTGDREVISIGDLCEFWNVDTRAKATLLWRELVMRGVMDEGGKVLDIPNWRKDAVGNRRANDYYEATIEAGEVVSIAEVEKRFGLKEKALLTYRKNQNRGRK